VDSKLSDVVGNEVDGGGEKRNKETATTAS